MKNVDFLTAYVLICATGFTIVVLILDYVLSDRYDRGISGLSCY